MSNCKIRVGQGYDVHRLVEGRPLILGGVQIPHSLGLDGHSDADDSTKLLSEALKKVWDKGWKPVNVDCTIIAQKPKLAPFMNQINSSLAAILQLPVDCVNVKAKTNEKLGFEGKEEGIVAQAVILLEARA